MIAPLTPNTQAILLLTAPLAVGRTAQTHDLLSLGDYNRLARLLRQRQRQPADLLGPDVAEVIAICVPTFDEERLKSLLGRGFLLSQAVERWNTRAIWVLSRADANYPKRLKSRLKEDAPPVLYGCGDSHLLETGGFAVVGSRHVDDALLTYTAEVGRLIAHSRRNLISGGARGIDEAAMRGAANAGGTTVGVLADSLERAALNREHREGLIDGRLTLVSPYDPAAGFNVGHAMQRNKVIYALADAALVVNSDFNKGGTWAGAVEQLDKYRCGPLFVRTHGNVGKGNDALLRKGALPWSDPKDGVELERVLASATESVLHEQRQESLPLIVEEAPPSGEEIQKPNPAPPMKKSEIVSQSSATNPGDLAAQLLHSTIIVILQRELSSPVTESQVAERLNVLKPQAKAWLAQLVEEGRVEKLSQPVRFRWVKSN